MGTIVMKFPFGRCAICGYEFNSELRNEYEITHCPRCGEKIDDYFALKGEPSSRDIFCKNCGTLIYEQNGTAKGGSWITRDKKTKQPGVCSGPCERELCGRCGDWDEEGCCPKCHEVDGARASGKMGWWKVDFNINLFKGEKNKKKMKCSLRICPKILANILSSVSAKGIHRARSEIIEDYEIDVD
jgi:DNA-directed RNA polymerase subunit RPC12/RpoP